MYVMVMIEHLPKWVEVKALPAKDSIHTAAAMNESVFCRYGARPDVLTDQGTEFHGEFQTLLDDNLVDHRLTARDHPEADSLAERMVQTLKKALRKYCLEHGASGWDTHLPYAIMGYRMSKHASLKDYSPYF